MDYISIIAVVATFILGLGFGWIKYVFASGKLLKEVGEFMTAVGRAVEDENVSNDEVAAILKEYNDIGPAWDELKSLRGK